MLNEETVPAATLVANTNLSAGSTERRSGLLWQEPVQVVVLGGGRVDALSAPVLPLIWMVEMASAMWSPTKSCWPSVARPTGVVSPAGLEVEKGEPAAVKLPPAWI